MANLKELVGEFRAGSTSGVIDKELSETIFGLAQRSGMLNDVPLFLDPDEKDGTVTGTELPRDVLENGSFASWIVRLSDYLTVLQDRLFSSGLRYDSHDTDRFRKF